MRRYGYGYGIAVPMKNCTLTHGFTGILVPNFWSGEWSYDLVDSLTTLLNDNYNHQLPFWVTTTTTPPPSLQTRAGGGYLLVLGNNNNDSPSLATMTWVQRRGQDDDEQETTHHPPPASRATARGVDSGWNDGDDQEETAMQDDGNAGLQ